jgi:hypothetical protein
MMHQCIPQMADILKDKRTRRRLVSECNFSAGVTLIIPY